MPCPKHGDEAIATEKPILSLKTIVAEKDATVLLFRPAAAHQTSGIRPDLSPLLLSMQLAKAAFNNTRTYTSSP